MLLLLALVFAFIARRAEALSSADIASVFSNTTDLTGISLDLPEFVLGVVTNSTHALISLNGSTPVSAVGWWATAVGVGMGNADFLVAWPNVGPSNITWTLSHRQSTGFVPPVVTTNATNASTLNFFSIVPELTTSDPTSSWTSLSFIRLLDMPANYPTTSKYTTIGRDSTSFLYASCSVRPPSAAEDSSISKHDQAHASIIIDLSTPAGLVPGVLPTEGDDPRPSWSSESWPEPRPGAVKSSLTRRDKILAAHAGIGSIALLLFSPLAILVARYTRHLLPWFKIHASIQIAAYILISIAFSLGVYAAKSPHFSNSHTRLGLVIFTSLTGQVALGVFAHRTPAFRTSVTPPDPNSLQTTAFTTIKGKPLIRLAHIAFGLTITILGWCQIRLGLEEWVDYSDSGNDVPAAVIVIFWALVGVESAEVFLGRFMKEEMNHDAVNRALSSRYNSTSRVNSRVNASVMARNDTEGTVGSHPQSERNMGGSSSGESLPVGGDSSGASRERDSDEITVVEEPAGKGGADVGQEEGVPLQKEKAE